VKTGRAVVLGAGTVLLLGLAGPARAQGLGDAAAREKQKRKEQPKIAPARVFTDADLQAKEKGGDATEGEAPADAEAAAPKKGGDGATAAPAGGAEDPLERERQERKLQEAEWRMRFANAREQEALAEAACWQEVVRTEFQHGIPVQVKTKEFVESEEYRQAKKALADLEEQFRRTGLPAGWARER
jgi:hypothetical protein